jgi:hypothetical protein
METQANPGLDLAALQQHLVAEHGYRGSHTSV